MITTISAAELLDFGLCTGQCLLGQEDDCICRCRGRWHGALADAQVVVPADLTLAEALAGAAPSRRRKRRHGGHGRKPEDVYAGLLAKGEVPSVRAIRRDMRVGQPKAQGIRTQLEAALRAA
jgi:hypothetical protein